MASYTIGTAAWTNGSHKVTFAYLSARHALFATSADQLLTSTVPPLRPTSATNQTITTLVSGPAGAYETKDTYNQEITVTGSTKQLKWTGDYNDAYYSTAGVSGGATHASLKIKTTKNIYGNAIWRVWFRPTVNSSSGATYVDLPNTPDNTWLDITLPLSATHTGKIAQVMVELANLADFQVGCKLCVAAAYIHNGNNVVLRPGDSISPDYGVTNFNVDAIHHTYNATGPIFVVYTKEVFGGTTGNKTTQRTDTPIQTTLTGTIDGVSSVSSALNISAYVNLSASVTALSSVSSALDAQDISLMASTIRSKSKLIPSVTIKPVRPMGTATWTNGSHIVDGSVLGTPLNMRQLQAPYGVSTATNGMVWYAQSGLNINDSWGTNVGYVDGIASDYYSYQVKNLPNVQSGAVSYTYGGADQGEEYCDGATLKQHSGYSAIIPGGYSAVCMTARLEPGYQYQMSLSAEADTGLNLTTNVRNVVAPDGLAQWHNYEFTGITSNNINKVCFFREFSSWYNAQLLVDNIMFYPPNEKNIVKPMDMISPDGGATNYRVLKVMLTADFKPVYVLETAYTGVSGDYDVLRTYAPVVYERSFNADIPTASTVTAPQFTYMKFFTTAISNAASVVGHLLRSVPLQSAITTASTFGAGRLTRLQSLMGEVFGVSGVSSPKTTLISSFKSTIAAVGDSPAVEFIRYKFNTAVINATSAITKAHIGQWRFFGNAAIDAVSAITSTRTSLIFYATQIFSNGAAAVSATLGFVKVLYADVINAFSSNVPTTIEVGRGITTQIDAVSAVRPIPINIMVGYTAEPITGEVTSFTAKPRFITGLMPVTIAAYSGVAPLHIILQSAFNTAIDAAGDIITSGEFRPIKFLNVTINANSSVSSFFVRDIRLGAEIYDAAEINAAIIKTLALTTQIDGVSDIHSYISVPEKLRELLITSAGVIIGGKGNVVDFSTTKETTPITVRGLTVVQLTDLVAGTNQTYIMLD